MAEPDGKPYKVCYSQATLDELEGLAASATSLGMAGEFLEALKLINEKLTFDPLAWGDPQYRLPALGLLICHGITSMLHVYYGVNEEHHLVFVKEILPLPNSLLGNE